MEELWKDIPGHEGRYAASSTGKVKNLKTGREISKRKYPKAICILWDNNGKKRTWLKHKLIALTFFGPCPDGLIVCHGPRGRCDNSIDNLSYGTHIKNNTTDYERDNPGYVSTGCKLNRSQVRVIKHLINSKNFRHKDIAEIFFVTRETISAIAQKRTWKTV
jgi:hypothetical protein